MQNDVLIDSSFLFAINSTRDMNHAAAVDFLRTSQSRLVIPEVTLPEVAHLLRERIGPHAVRNLLKYAIKAAGDMQNLTAEDYRRAHEIMSVYATAKFDLVDCCIMALSERLGITYECTFDRRDFGMFRPRHVDYLRLLPE